MLVTTLFLAFQSNATFTGISSEVHAVNGIPGYTTYRIYADFDDVGDQLVQVFGLDVDPLFITSTGDIYQNAAGGGLSSDIGPALFPFVPELIYDSWLTIGAEDNTTSGLIALGLSLAAFEAGNDFVINDVVGGAWFILPGSMAEAYATTGKVLLAQITTNGDLDIQLNVQWRDALNNDNLTLTQTLSQPFILPGCIDPNADNYDLNATEDDGSCTYPAPSYDGLSFELVASDAVIGFDTYRVYANFTNPFDQVVAVYGQDVNPLSISTTGTFYQNPGGGPTSSNINPALYGVVPELEYDSWVTIGTESQPNSLNVLGVDFSSYELGSALLINDAFGGGWFVIPDSEPTAFPDGTGRVLLGQFTTDGITTFSAALQYRAQNGESYVENESISFPDLVLGCTNSIACNYDAIATDDDGSCNLPDGCTSSSACNYDSTAQCDNGSCILPDGCTNALACNYDLTAQCDNGSCILPDGCTNALACNYDLTAQCDNGSCILPDGCTDALACNYDLTAQCDNGSCILPDGCTNALACNYDLTAQCDNGSCILPDGCTNALACNYDLTAQCDNGSCILPDGCTNALACNYDLTAQCDNGSCILPDGCTNALACNYDLTAQCDNGSCILPDGCTNALACNYDLTAQCDNGSCILPDGCTDALACNYDLTAQCDNGSCILPDGCTNALACNYDLTAQCDNGSCILPDGCTNALACNYDLTAQCDNGSCILPDGCTDASACNYDLTAQCDNGSCILPDGCTNALACNYDLTAQCDNGSCILPDGCTNALACNYDLTAQCDNGSCILPDGCTDALACNYDSTALCDDGSCELLMSVETVEGQIHQDVRIQQQIILMLLQIVMTILVL